VAGFFLNPFSVVLLPSFDRDNERATVFCDWKLNELNKVSGVGYDVFELVEFNQNLDTKDLTVEMNKYLNYFIDHGVVEFYE